MFAICFYDFTVEPTLTQNDTELDWSYSYCFQFTWLGPEYDNQTNYNGTCEEYFENTDSDGIPCKMPLVVTCENNFLVFYVRKFYN